MAVDTQPQIEKLLRPLTAIQQSDYYAMLLPSGVSIQYGCDDGKGKRLIATQAFKEGEVIFREAPFVAAQHAANKADALVCAQCFRYIGSIEQQLAHRMLGDATDTSGGAHDLAGGNQTHSAHVHDGSCGYSTMTDARDAAAETAAAAAEDEAPHSAGGAAADGDATPTAPGGELSASLRVQLRRLADGANRLPHSERFQLPASVPCPGGCAEDVFCSAACAQAAWDSHHRLLCLGNSRDGSCGSGSGGCAAARAAEPDHIQLDNPPAALAAFKQHADATNDIFHVAARAVAGVCLRAQQKLDDGQATPEQRRAALEGAWVPVAAGWKAIWWDAVALPEDVTDDAAFRKEMLDLAAESLALLQGALPAQVAAFPALFSLPIYGAVIGMFELNNLGLVVASPVEDYFLLLDGLPEENGECEAAMEAARPLLDALGEDYDAPAEGTAFYALQSCMNHSCQPNAQALKGDGDVTGDCVISARRAVAAGEELDISYIDETLAHADRQAALRDYGFVCRCGRCLREGGGEPSGSSRKRPADADAARV